ncbi:DUF2489 domain-containing protein [Lacimicrobium sp. SS2-24]|uniref:DUF2489 domain-containing protein n=1 Tax=Lacimicrobium sp. SS2-24 TaxID=2005569 RepID=UPI000B4BECBD|nr:DUF2489 domain-containing protein [Lacimicrobium sp. SS2-24]
MTGIHLSLIIIVALIVIGLAFYAGRLLYLLHMQTKTRKRNDASRRHYLNESIYTISMATAQQQCSLSEASIRLCVLLDHLNDQQHYPDSYPALHELYSRIKHMPTHDAWKALPKAQRREMERERDAHEAELESQILKEVEQLMARHLPSSDTSSKQ